MCGKLSVVMCDARVSLKPYSTMRRVDTSIANNINNSPTTPTLLALSGYAGTRNNGRRALSARCTDHRDDHTTARNALADLGRYALPWSPHRLHST